METDKGYIAFIANPKSGASSGKRLCRGFHAYLQTEGYDVRLQPTTSLANACDLAAAAAADENCQLVTVAGGDGTVREITHGMEGCDKPLLLIPCGNENLLASELGFDEKLTTLIKTFEGGHTKPLDLCTFNGKCFTCITGIGFDGEVVHRVTQHRQGHVDYFDYADPLWSTFWSYKFKPISVELDGKTIFNGQGLVFVGNISRYAMGLHILRRAEFGDGLLDVCIYKCASRMRFVKHALLTVMKRHAGGKDVIYAQGKHVLVSSPYSKMKTEIDGDPGPPLPAEITIKPQAIRVMVPEGVKPAGIRTRIVRAIG